MSPLLGYNNNFRHKSRVFHIQTEDSGIKHPHIITHLFADGGRIIKSVKTSYAEYVGNERMRDIVKEMMKQQHKAMIIALRDGQFDAIIEAQGAGAVATPAPAPAAAANPAAPVPTPPPSIPDRLSDFLGEPSPNGELTLDIEALERVVTKPGPAAPHGSDLPPPPDNLFREKTATSGYRSVFPPGEARPSRPPPGTRSMPPPVPSAPRVPSIAAPKAPSLAPGRPASIPPPPPPARYGNPRPPAIFGNTRPTPGKGVFGEAIAEDNSLDDVILSYLAEELVEDDEG